MSGLTPSQTVGPFFRIGLERPQAQRLAPADASATITVSGRVLDGDGAAVPDALIEIWQADGAGRYHATRQADGFFGWGRCACDSVGRFAFNTVKPGPVRGDTGVSQAPHINCAVFARGLLHHLYTRIYFADESALNAADAVLGCVPAARRASLLARGDGWHYRFDIKLQGEAETVFFTF